MGCVGLLLLWVSACSPVEPTAAAGEPLLDGVHRPDVLIERRALAAPPSDSGNRFLRGWRPWKWMRKRRWYAPAPEGAVLELVTLADAERRLTISGRVVAAGSGAPVTVSTLSGDPRTQPLRFPLEVRLPAGRPLGRSTVEVRFPVDATVMVDRAWLDRATPAGGAELAPAAILQKPTSLVDIVRPVEAGARLEGVFEPPDDPSPGQRFRILIEREGRPARIGFDWSSGGWNRWLGARTVSIELGGEAGLARIRLFAEGTGAAGRWRDLRLVPRRRVRPPAPTPPPPPPRLVVVYVLDALRADVVDLSGDASVATPQLARMAREGVVFAHHRSVAPNTVPSTKALFTGRPFVLRGGEKLPADGPPTLAEVFAAAGYRTAAFSGNGYVSPGFGTTRGFAHVAGDAYFRDEPDRPGAYNDNAERVQASALTWLDEIASDERAFLYLHTIHPHNPYDPPDEIADRFTAGIDSRIQASTDELTRIRRGEREVDPADMDRIRGLYRGSLAYNDALIGALSEQLRRRVPRGELLMVVTSDHGEELFDHGGVLHGYTLHRELLEIPLILWWPERLEPLRIDAVTDNLDLHESLRALVGADPSPDAEGRSLWDLARGREERVDPERITFAAASSLHGGIFSARSARFKLVLAPRTGDDFGMGQGRGRSRDPEYLFDLAADPGEHHNVAGRPDLEVAWLRSRLNAWIDRGRRLEPGGGPDEVDEETRARIRALGYLD